MNRPTQSNTEVLQSPRRLILLLAFPLLVTFAGTALFHYTEGWPWFESLYMTVITISTVGYGEVMPIDFNGRLISLGLIVVGAGSILYFIRALTQDIVQGELRGLVAVRRTRKLMDKLNQHVILCGYGRIGREIARELSAGGHSFAVIESDPVSAEKAREAGCLTLEMDAKEDETMIAAGVERAKGLVTALPETTDNLFVALLARELNPELFILARGEDEASERRLVRAGADRVVSPYQMGGHRMAQILLRPGVAEYLDMVTRSNDLDLSIDEVVLPEGSPQVGKSLAQSNLRSQYDLIVIAVKKTDGKTLYNPDASILLEAGDKIIAMGPPENLKRLERTIL